MHRFHRFLATLLVCGLGSFGLASEISAQTRVSPDQPSFAGALLGFGSSAVVSGDRVFVGRPGQSDLFPMPGSEAGTAHVFARTADGWEETAMVAADDGHVGDGFGRAIAAGGDLMFVGSPTRDDGGAVYVFASNADGWTQMDRLAPPGLEPGDRFGQALAYIDQNLIVGAPGRGTAGTAYSFYVTDGGAVEHVEIPAEGMSADANYGAAVAIEGDLAVIGAPGPFSLNSLAGAPQFQAGTAVVLRGGKADWAQAGRLTPTGGGAFGLAVALSDGHAFASSPLDTQASGAVFEFAPDEAGEWGQVAKVTPASPLPGSFFGLSMSEGGQEMVVGAPGANGMAGAAYAFTRGSDGAWSESHMFGEQTTGLLGFYGSAVSGGDDVIVVGASAAEFFEGIGFVYEREADGWTLAGGIVEGEGLLPSVMGEEQKCSEEGAAAGFACEAVDLVSFMSIPDVGGRRGILINDVWGWTDPDTGREYAILGRFDGTAFVDVTDAANPRYLGSLPLTDGANPNLWRDMKVHANHTFIVADNAGQHGMQVFDLTRLRDVGSDPVEFDEDAIYDGIASAHNIVINEQTGFAYAVGNSGGGTTCGGALHMIDVRDPKSPTFAGCYADPGTGNASTGYTHDAQCVEYQGPDEDYRGREVCFNASENALGIGDVTDKDNPTPIASASYPNVNYSHQGWLSEDHRYFYLNDELDELSGAVDGTRTLVWDVADLDDPVLAAEHVSDNKATDHNLYIRGNFMYQANYVSGLRVFDISDPENPRPVGYFDTARGEDVPGFAGAFSTYPFFESGNILVSSMREGLFILRKQQPELVP
ncbi:MAG: choice-of-anchor B family protein [Gemmatimonadota bacterium]|nr:choice-of-anchor B family protein [Gemmatimonadota bacterium]